MENSSQVFQSEVEIESSKKGFVTTVFGQFATKVFWRDLIALVVKEAISSFIAVLGGTLIYAVQKRVTGESVGIKRIVDGHGTVGTQPQANPSSAFASGYQPQASYKPTYAPVAPVYNGTPPSYPGFGNP